MRPDRTATYSLVPLFALVLVSLWVRAQEREARLQKTSIVTVKRWDADAVDEARRIERLRTKASNLFSFAKYTTWPEGSFERPDSPVVFGIIGGDPFGTILEKAMEGRKLGERGAVIRRFANIEHVDVAHVLFVGELKPKDLRALLARCRAKPIFVVGAERSLVDRGAVAGFFLTDGKVHFAMSTDAIKLAGLEVSSQLLKLAEIIEKKKSK